jgi:hypothetical protein
MAEDPMLADFEPVVLEIIERTSQPHSHTIVPNEVRLNGCRLLTTDKDPVIVHEVSSAGMELVRVTLTLLARRVTFDTAPKEEKPG